MFCRTRRFVLWGSLAILASAALLTPGLAAPARAQQKTCHLLIFADTNDRSIGKSVMIDAFGMDSVFHDNIPGNQLKMVRVQGNRLNASTILRTIRDHPVRRQDTLIVYYAGHGGFDRKQGHFLAAGPRGNRYVLRSTIRRAMERKSVRLNILLTDCCSNIRREPLPEAAGGAMLQQVQGIAQAEPAFVSLCWKPRGFVDINSCKTGQIAAGDNLDGGYFTSSLTRYLTRNRRKQVSWQSLTRVVKAATSKKFRDKNPRGISYRDGNQRVVQRDQNPLARLQLEGMGGNVAPAPGPPAIAGGLRFGVRALERNGRLRITQVIDGSPAKRVRLAGNPNAQKLEVNDILLAINGRRITTEREYARAVDTSGRQMLVRIINHRDGRPYDLLVTLAY